MIFSYAMLNLAFPTFFVASPSKSSLKLSGLVEGGLILSKEEEVVITE